MKLQAALFLLLLSSTLYTVTAAAYCNISSGLSGNSSSVPKLPDLPIRFQTNFEVNIVDKNLTADYTEYFDYYGNRIKLSFHKQDQRGIALYLFDTNEAIYVTENVCKVANLSAQPEVDLFGEFSDDGYMHMKDSNNALKFGTSYGEVYMGPAVIRGINVEHWQSCLYWEKAAANFSVDYYFSTPNEWTTSSLFTSVPVQADVKGILLNPNGTYRSIHHVYNYFSFEPDISDQLSTTFETPPNVICNGRKNTKTLPDLPAQFYYRQEVILPNFGIVTTIDVWYDQEARLIRSDYRPLSAGPPTYNMNYVTEVYDFHEGVMYIKDNLEGNCTNLPFKNTTFGVTENSSALKYNGSYVLSMKNPLQLFYMNYNFTYVGQRPCRGMVCDVFSGIDPNYRVEGQTDGQRALFEIYFLSDAFTNYPNDGNSVTRFVPIKTTLSIDAIDFYQIYNFMDFDSNSPGLSVFDVSSCYDQAAQLHFNIRIPGQIKPSIVDSFLYQARQTMGRIMNVSPLRIQKLRVDYDYADVYLHATLLDRTPAQYQFTHIVNKEIENQDDIVIGHVQTPVECAEMCVYRDNFTCNSFDFCPGDTLGSCRLSKSHIGDGKANLINSTCGHFSRTVNGLPVPETSVIAAYSTLRKAVYKQQFAFTVYIDNQPLESFVGVHTEVTFGWIAPVAIPTFSGYFSYRQEFVIPSQGEVFETQVWFDTDYKLTRYDYHDRQPVAPFFSTNPMTVIHDFNSGIQYTIDKFFDNCTITQIQPGSLDSDLDIADRMKDGSYVVQMKSPLELFHITTDYRFIGQKTVRGLLTNVYEVVMKKFTMPGLQGSYDAILEYYFLMDGWSQSGLNDDSDTVKYPVKMDLTILERGLFLTYNYYDFEEQHPDLSLFDIKNCFASQDQHTFQITFPGLFHPYLDTWKKLFEMESQRELASASGVSVLRFQETTLNYDAFNIYITSTILGNPPYLTWFTLIPGSVPSQTSDAVFTGLSSPTECAKACLSLNRFPCNSFNYCPATKACYLSKSHIINGTLIDNTTSCSHYSRTVNASSVVSPDMWTAFNALKNTIYSGLLNVKIPSFNNSVRVYQATSIKDTEPRPTDALQGGLILQQHFTVSKNKELSVKTNHILTGLAIDDCAAACLMEELFDCQSFEYCLTDGSCLLSTIHPDINQSLVQPKQFCNLYSRSYLDHYNEVPGKTFPTDADEVILNVPTANLCAKQCTVTAKCKSFDYCQNKGCRLKDKHILDAPGSFYQTSATCNHYSREYIDDFRFVQGKKLSVGPMLEFDGVSVDQCAKLCVEQEGTMCHSFAYCANYTKCELLPANPRFLPSGTVTNSQFCNLYIRRFDPANMPPPPNHTVVVNETQYKYISQKSNVTGPVLGTAFGALIVGLVIGAAAAFFFRKYKQKDTDMNMSIIGNEET